MDDTEEGVCVMADPTAAASASHLVAGKDYPADLAQFRARFATDDAYLDFLDWIRWPVGSHYPYCHSRSAGGAVGRYRCKGCDRHISVTAGAVFDKPRAPLTVWFETLWLMVADKSGVSTSHLYRMLPISSYQTAWTMLAKLRTVMATSHSQPLTGRVEVDETFFGGPQPGTTGRGAAGKTLVAGAVETTQRGWGRSG